MVGEEGEVEATRAAAGAIKAIDRGVVHQICSGQVVLTLATAVKELVENSLDAGATSVEVRLLEHGSALVEVSDNGEGVEECNMLGLTLKHHTSKLREFTDLASVETFGFRGEALSSLCALSRVEITTRHKAATTGTAMTYDHNGSVVTRSSVARSQGTTVALHNLFSTMPVRHREFLRNIKKEFSKLVAVISGYSLVSTGVRITCTNQVGKGRKTVVLQTHGSQTVRENLVAVFGAKQAQTLVHFKQVEGEVSPGARVEGWVSSPGHGEGRGAPDRQFYYINSRPCDPTRLSKAVNQVYHGYNKQQYPFVFLNVHTERATVDINLTPDKRQVLIHKEKLLVQSVQSSLEAMYRDCPATLQLNTSVLPREEGMQKGGQKRGPPAFSRGDGAVESQEKKQRTLSTFFTQKDESQEKKQRTLSTFFTQKVGPDGDSQGHREGPEDDEIFIESKVDTEELAVQHNVEFNPTEGLNPRDSEDEENKENRTGVKSFVNLPVSEQLLKDEIKDHGEGLEDFLDNPGDNSDRQVEAEEVEENEAWGTSFGQPSADCEVQKNDNERALDGLKISFGCSSTSSSTERETYSSEQIVSDGLKISFDGPATGSEENLSRQIVSDGLKISFDGPATGSEESSSQQIVSGGLNISFESPATGGEESSSQQIVSDGLKISFGCSSTESELESSQGIVSDGLKISFDSLPPNSQSRAESCQVEGLKISFDSLPERPVVSEKQPSQRSTSSTTESRASLGSLVETSEDVTDSLIPEPTRKRRVKPVSVAFSMACLRSGLAVEARSQEDRDRVNRFKARIEPGENRSAEEELNKQIQKTDFAKMEIFGQFNLGFMIVGLQKDLFIVDQHATDEKYNFETLQLRTHLKPQPMVVPQKLELTVADEAVLLDNLPVFQKNGFQFDVDTEAIAGRRVRLAGLPTSRNWVFGKEDIEELIFMLAESGEVGEEVAVRPSRVRAMFASRACRSSVMIGSALSRADMRRLISHMGEIEQPWNCPHGRPTIRHLLNTDMVL